MEYPSSAKASVKSLPTILAASLLLAPAAVAAQFQSGTSSWISSPTGEITFDGSGLSAGNPITDQYQLSHGVTFENLELNTGTGTVYTAPYAINWIGLQPWPPISFSFASPIISLAFLARANSGSAFFEAFLEDAPVFSGFLPIEPNVLRWFGFEGATVDRIRITAPSGTNGLIAIDNVQWLNATLIDDEPPVGGDVVPEPATMTLLATGMAGLLAARRRKRGR